MYSKHIWKELKLFLEYKELLIPPTPFLYAARAVGGRYYKKRTTYLRDYGRD